MKKYFFILLSFFMTFNLYAQNNSCSLATPFIDNNCVVFSPPTQGPVTRCYSFYLESNSVDFNFIPFVPVGTCQDEISRYTLYDSNCNPIDTTINGDFFNLTENLSYTICYTIQCPTTGVINLLCTYELITLPIELLYFNSRTEYNNIKLIWETATETNNCCFTIYHSTDFKNWLNIGSVEGAGNSNIPITYSFTFDRPLEGINYFKLQQEDFDGNKTEFNSIAVYFIKKNRATDIFQKYNILGQKIN